MSGIAVGIDGSHNAYKALDWAVTEAALRKADLTVFAVHAVPASYWTGAPVALPSDEGKLAEIRQSAEDAVGKAVAALGDEQPRSVSVVALSGFPAKTLVEASEKSDLMVLGSRGSGGFGAMFVGSVTTQVVHHAKCPVVVVPAGS
ncbi:MAG: universal stress protein [Actinobacteria bacterium]|nr:universal stress protein [Actinomycetota bacterium]MBO0837574.1 universal stress protein [Actinomycetota bacterium]